MPLDVPAGPAFGPYAVVRPIGEGGMAQVYLCVRRGAGGFEKPVVLKVIHSRLLADDAMLEMFVEEARLLSRMQHPHIVDVYEVETRNGVPYLVMAYVNGPTLHQLRRHVGRPQPEQLGFFLLVVAQVCQALHYAHTLTVDGQPLPLVHRDVSSQNILVQSQTGMAKLIDFGIAKAADTTVKTEHGLVKGKLPYLAPEVLAGAPPDARSDLFAVGVLLYWLLTGRMPFTRKGPFHNPEQDPPVDLSSVEGLPDALPPLVMAALATEPEARPPSADALARDLRAIARELGADPAGLAAFVDRVFPRGPEDWQVPLASKVTNHTALDQLTTERDLSTTASTGWVIALAVVAIIVALLASVLILTASLAGIWVG